jgi:K+-transporting ATPase c subunit
MEYLKSMMLPHAGPNTNTGFANFYLAAFLFIYIILICRTAFGLLPLLIAHENRDTGKTGSLIRRFKDSLSGRKICGQIFL